jgi:hypothetical protein
MTPPPTSIDGTDITGATIDGQEVQEITIDGQTVFTAIPDSGKLQAHYDATESASPGSNLVTDISGNGHDLSGAFTISSGRINGLDAIFLDGSQSLSTSFPSAEPQPNRVFAVVEPKWGAQNGETIFDVNNGIVYESGAGGITGQVGSDLIGNNVATTTVPQILEFGMDGANSQLFRDNINIGSGSVGTADSNGFTLGGRTGGSSTTELFAGEILFYKAEPDRAAVYDYLSRWNIV